MKTFSERTMAMKRVISAVADRDPAGACAGVATEHRRSGLLPHGCYRLRAHDHRRDRRSDRSLRLSALRRALGATAPADPRCARVCRQRARRGDRARPLRRALLLQRKRAVHQRRSGGSHRRRITGSAAVESLHLCYEPATDGYGPRWSLSSVCDVGSARRSVGKPVQNSFIQLGDTLLQFAGRSRGHDSGCGGHCRRAVTLWL